MYICIYTHIAMYLSLSLSLPLSLSLYIYIYTYIHTYIHTYICRCICDYMFGQAHGPRVHPAGASTPSSRGCRNAAETVVTASGWGQDSLPENQCLSVKFHLKRKSPYCNAPQYQLIAVCYISDTQSSIYDGSQTPDGVRTIST